MEGRVVTRGRRPTQMVRRWEWHGTRLPPPKPDPQRSDGGAERRAGSGTRKSEIRSTKSETNPKDRNSKHETEAAPCHAEVLRSISRPSRGGREVLRCAQDDTGARFGFRISCFGFRAFLSHHGHSGVPSSPAVSGCPVIRFAFCTACPAAPFPRLSIAPSAITIPRSGSAAY